MTSSVNVFRRFSDYQNIGIYLNEYIIHPITISGAGALTNKTTLIVCNSSQINVSSGGVIGNQSTTNLKDSIKLIFRAGTSLNINAGGLLDVGENTKVVFNKGSAITVGGVNSRIIVRNGGKLIIEPDVTLNLLANSKLIVEDGGQVIIQNNNASPANATESAKLIYNAGAEIQLKGDNAVLELNGKLHIADNATFTFTYPGANSGYIKFNRGFGNWWDNWATGNQHITCGVNARIYLVGQSKTDKILEVNQNRFFTPKNLLQLAITKGLVSLKNGAIETPCLTNFNNATFTGIEGIAVPDPEHYYPMSGVIMFGQKNFVAINCDFNSLDYGILGVQFYLGYPLRSVLKCNFNNCNTGIMAYGVGGNIQTNNFNNNNGAIIIEDNTQNSIVTKNIILGGGSGITIDGNFTSNEISKNIINNNAYAMGFALTSVKIRCNQMQNNGVCVGENVFAKVNMSSLLGGGYNDCSYSDKIATFVGTDYFDANQGFNTFNINNTSPCYITATGPGHIPIEHCPTITEGTISNYTSYDAIKHEYFSPQENNFWRVNNTTVLEKTYNKLTKLVDPLVTTTDFCYDPANCIPARFETTNPLTSNVVNCPAPKAVGTGNNNGNQNSNAAKHPLDDNSNSVSITTASFYNKKLQKALLHSLSKHDNADNDNKLNEVADLYTEILKYNYQTPITSLVDNYLLEITYSQYYSCVVQLIANFKDNDGDLKQLTPALQTRINDLNTIIDLRINRKDPTAGDYKHKRDFMLLDKAFVKRLTEDRQGAITIINNVLASYPKSQFAFYFEYLICSYKNEEAALNGTISNEEFLKRYVNCKATLNVNTPKIKTDVEQTARLFNKNKNNDVVYAKDVALVVFPNPTAGSLNIQYDLKEYNEIIFELTDLQGKTLISSKLNNQENSYKFDNLNLSNGVYIYTIKADNESLMTEKLVIVK